MLKKALKILTYIVIIFFSLILILLLVIRILFPPEKVKKIICTQLETAFQRNVDVGEVWFNPFKGILLNQVVIYEKSFGDTTTIDSTWFFKINQIQLRYNLFSLLRKEIQINKILLLHPEINLVQNKDQQWNFEDLIVSDTSVVSSTAIAAEDTSTKPLEIPFSLKLRELSVENFTLNLNVNTIENYMKISSGGITLKIRDFFLPRQLSEKFYKHVKTNLILISDNQPWRITLKKGSPETLNEIDTNLQLDLETKLNGLEKVMGKAELALTDFKWKAWNHQLNHFETKTFPLPRLLEFTFKLSGNAEQDSLAIQQFMVKVGDETILNITGQISHLLNQPYMDLTITDSKIHLDRLFSAFQTILPDSIRQQFQKLSFQGILSLNGSHIIGSPLSDSLQNGLSFYLNLVAESFNATYLEPFFHLSNLNLNLSSSGTYTNGGIQKSDFSIKINADSISTALDSTSYSIEGIHVDAMTTLNHQFKPDSLSTVVKIDNFFEAPLDFKLKFKQPSSSHQYQANARLTLKELSLESLSYSAIQGFIDFDFEINSQSLDRIYVSLNLVSDIIEVMTEEESIIIYPFDIVASMVLNSDSSFQKIQLKDTRFLISDFALLAMQGTIDLPSPQQFNIFIDTLKIDHKKLLEIIPEQFLEGMENLKLSGESNLTARIFTAIPEKAEPVIDVNSEIIIQGDVDYPENELLINDFKGHVFFTTNGKTAKALIDAQIDTVTLTTLQDDPISDITFTGKFFMPDFETVKIESTFLDIPGLKSHISIAGQIDSLSNHTQANGSLQLFVDAGNDSVRFLNDICLTGTLTQKSKIHLKNNLLHIDGNLLVKNLNVAYADLLDVQSIVGQIYFSELIDIENSSIIEKSKDEPLFASVGSYNYNLFRPYYQYCSDNFSHISITKLKAMDYYVDDINLDFIIQNEKIEIPYFSLHLYDGNMSGLFSVNLHQGNPEDIEWYIKANVSRLNSAKLLPKRKVKTRGSDLNMNLELSGKGIDPQQDLTLQGYLYVTKIGPKFTDNVLRSLDPRGTDKGIQDTRKLLNWGYKPKLISFEIKHDNLYPSIHLVKGNLFTKLIPLNISGGKIELARIPLKILLANMEVETR